MLKQYRYVGPSDILSKNQSAPQGIPIACADDLWKWVKLTEQKADAQGVIVATFVVGLDGCLRLADRRSEHVACAGGESVLSAGEISFVVDGHEIEVVEVSNQSTGYCPEPESWPQVGVALDCMPLRHPGRFTQEIVFRRCPSCGAINVVKEGWFVCIICGHDLPGQWNVV